MNWLFESISAGYLEDLEVFLGDWFFVFSIAFLAVELIIYAVRKRFNWALAGDTATNFVTQVFFFAVSLLLFYTFYVSGLSFFHRFALFDLDINWMAVIICIVFADIAYYWEHRFTHRVAIAWATHTVHHSSPHFNISVAYRFGPIDAFWPFFFHVPLVLVGFDPFVVIFAEAFVLLYQTVLHTEIVGKLPRPIEAVFNTPSHHRVHHGSNEQYIDRNYAGIFIIWDRMFGTFAEEEEQVVYGITTPLNSVNPFVVFFHGLTGLWEKVHNTSGLTNKIGVLIRPPS